MKFLVLLVLTPGLLLAEPASWSRSDLGELTIARFSAAPFPHPQRAAGHRRQGAFYPAARHYQDSRVAIFIPQGYRPGAQVDLVFHFHGWFGSVDQVIVKYRLAEQFYESRKNAVLIVPQGPLKAPDSFGGKLEDRGGFRNLVEEVARFLHGQGKIREPKVGRVILSGHSGAYRVIAAILAVGGLRDQIDEVFLFDALYGQTGRYLTWLTEHRGRLVAYYTGAGGTQRETERLMAALRSEQAPLKRLVDENLAAADLKDHRSVFVFSRLGHDQVLYARSGFRLTLGASRLDERGSV